MNPISYLRRSLPVSISLALLVGILMPLSASASQEYTQDFTLQPGWNAIYLEVDPGERDPSAVFQGLPIRSVWTWRSRQTSLEFVADASERRLRSSGWLGYFPSNRLESYLSNLVEIQVNRAYLVKLGGTAPVNLSVTGRPSLRKPRWQPDSFNLVGFGVTQTPPTFQAFFAGSPAHAGQPIYRLEAGGTWRLAQPSETMRAGEAFWVFADGGSSYNGPIEVDLVGDELSLGSVIEQTGLLFTNHSPSASTITFRRLSESGGTDVLLEEDPSITQTAWSPLPTSKALAVASGQTVVLQLGPDRDNVGPGGYQALYEVTDGAARQLLAVSVDPVVPAATRSAKAGATTASGLWLGNLVINQVNQVHATEANGDPGDYTELSETPAEFRARVLIHVDEAGTARLLKDVLQMWTDGTSTTDPESGLQVTETPGRFVLVTDKSQLANYSGAALRGNEAVGRRMSSAFVDFTGDEMAATSGSLVAGGSLEFSWTLGANHPTNPFRHKFHPDHDGTAPTFDPGRVEVYEVGRAMTFAVAGSDPEGAGRPDWGTTRLAGTFSEQLSGLHKRTIRLSGTFTLTRISTDGVLNP